MVTPSELDVLKCMRQAAGEGRLDKILAFIRFFNLNQLNECLLRSCFSGHINIVHWLLCNTQADYNCKDILGCTSLTISCNQGNWDIVKYFIDTKRLDLFKSSTWSNILSMVGQNILEISVRYIIEFSSLEQRNTALVDSCEKGDLNVTKLLVSKAGADVNFQKYLCGESTLSIACTYNKWHIVRYLISSPYFVPTKHDIDNILHNALRFGSAKEFKYLAVFVSESILSSLLFDACKLENKKS